MAICMVLVFASGYLIIYNIFQISVAGDIRFYGRLKTLGPADTFRRMYPHNTLRKLFFDLDAEYQTQAEEMLIDYRNNVDRSLYFTSKSTLVEHYKEQTRANTVMGFAISLIIAFVGVLNFVNSMVTAIVSRQKEFAMIQSVGMTKRQLRSMLTHEGLYYAVETLVVSYILSVFGT